MIPEQKIIRSCSKKHLMEIGLVPGTHLYILSYSFGMVIIFFRGAKYALRKEDFENIQFEAVQFL